MAVALVMGAAKAAWLESKAAAPAANAYLRIAQLIRISPFCYFGGNCHQSGRNAVCAKMFRNIFSEWLEAAFQAPGVGGDSGTVEGNFHFRETISEVDVFVSSTKSVLS